MSYGVPQTLRPNDTIAEAAGRMRRYGFEGFPVLENGRIVGMLTRREIDRALHHGLDRHLVSRYMHSGEVYVRPGDSVETLRHVMTEHDWGQVPVVDAATGKLVGIVTRTDLIKQWATTRAPGPARLDQQMAAALPAPLLRWLQQAGAVAQEMGFHLYAVGGFVRDLLLGLPNDDIDLVVEGDAIALAQRVSERLGGHVRSHQRFGTAKWLVPAPLRASANGSLPDSLDFVTARTEFYEHPTALPTVEASNIRHDLHRRDFTINTLAVRLEPDRWAELLDFYGGQRDLERGLIRVLHNLSFVEDPTRILRAVRFEQRFRFAIEPRTKKLIGDARDLLDRVSGERVRHELEAIVMEAEPERTFCRLAQLEILEVIQPGLECSAWLQERAILLRGQFAEARNGAGEMLPAMDLPPDALPRLYLALVCYQLPADAVAGFIARYRWLKEQRNLLTQTANLKPRLARGWANRRSPTARSRVGWQVLARKLASWPVWPATPGSCGCAWILINADFGRSGRSSTETICDVWASPPGLCTGRSSTLCRAARLDGEIDSRAGEEALALLIRDRSLATEARGSEPMRSTE